MRITVSIERNATASITDPHPDEIVIRLRPEGPADDFELPQIVKHRLGVQQGMIGEEVECSQEDADAGKGTSGIKWAAVTSRVQTPEDWFAYSGSISTPLVLVIE